MRFGALCVGICLICADWLQAREADSASRAGERGCVRRSGAGKPVAAGRRSDRTAFEQSVGRQRAGHLRRPAAFRAYNCTGCHANGGGGIGPPLIKSTWIYGGEPENIFDTIVKGRPNGMPAWGGKIPEYQIWQLVTWVRAMNKEEPHAATPTARMLLNRIPAPFSILRRRPGEMKPALLAGMSYAFLHCACAGPQSALDPAASEARITAGLMRDFTILLGTIFVIVIGVAAGVSDAAPSRHRAGAAGANARAVARDGAQIVARGGRREHRSPLSFCSA